MIAANDRSLSLKRRLTALSIAAVAGVIIEGALMQAVEALLGLIATGRIGSMPPADVVPIYLMVGSIIAVPLCLLVGLPLLARAERTGRRTCADAIRVGASAGLVIGLVLTTVQVAVGVETWLDDSSSFSSASYGVLLVSDGMPTATGWLMEALDVAGYCLAGGCAGIVAYAIAFGCYPASMRSAPDAATVAPVPGTADESKRP